MTPSQAAEGVPTLEEQIAYQASMLKQSVLPSTIAMENAILASLRRLSAQNTEGWRPIESAPRDVRVLVFGGTYSTGDHEDMPSAGISIAHLMGSYGWLDDAEYDGNEIWRKPTHWRPLPAPPTLASRDEP